MVWCDKNTNVLEWGSEEIIIPYVSPMDQKVHRYFPDFYVKALTREGRNQKYVIEVKPAKQCAQPIQQKTVTRRYLTEVTTYAVNQAKWKAAREYCADRRMEFLILTEKELNI